MWETFLDLPDRENIRDLIFNIFSENTSIVLPETPILREKYKCQKINNIIVGGGGAYSLDDCMV